MNNEYGVELMISKMTPMGARRLQQIGSKAMMSGDKNKFERAIKLENGYLKRVRDPRLKSGLSGSGTLVAKRDNHRTADGALIGAGGVTAATGLAAGGIPGMKSHASGMSNSGTGWRREFKADAKGNRARAAAMPGGVFGYRTEAHKKATKDFEADKAKNAGAKKLTRVQHFLRGRGTGKIGPEYEIMRDLKGGRLGATAALVGGTAAVGYGIHGHKKHTTLKKNKRSDKEETAAGALIGTGAATTAVGAGGQAVLNHQGRKWRAKSDVHVKQAGDIIPGLKGMNRPVGDHTRLNRKTFAGTSNARAGEAGALHGAATQERYFSHVYHKNAKYMGRLKKPGLAAIGIGGALAYEAHREKKKK